MAVTLHSWNKVELELDSMVANIARSSPYKVLQEGMPNCHIHNGADTIIVVYWCVQGVGVWRVWVCGGCMWRVCVEGIRMGVWT